MLSSNFIWAGAPAPYTVRRFERTLQLPCSVREGSVRITALGIYRLYVNGAPVTQDCLTPGFTVPNDLPEQTYDLTSVLHEGENTVSIDLAPGWAAGAIARDPEYRYTTPNDLPCAVAACIDLNLTDGGSMRVVTDEHFDVYTTPYTYADLYGGETYDGTLTPQKLGCAVRFDATGIRTGRVAPPPVREQERVAPSRLIITPKGERVIDFGQNLAGYTEIRYRGVRGDRIRLSFAEILDKDGNFYNENYRESKNDILYILDGEREIYKPNFTFQGYRYVRIDEFPSEVRPEYFTSVALYSDMRRIGELSCGDVRILRLLDNVLWGMRSNFVSLPTDCPQRDERLGWTGDAQVFCRTACLLYDTKAFYTSWLHDMQRLQLSSGAIPSIIPNIFDTIRVSTAWADAATVCPFEIYLAYGDRELLRQHYPMMRRWVAYMDERSHDGRWIGGMHFGDWLATDAGVGSYVGATQTDLIACAFFAHSTDLCLRAARILGEDTVELTRLYERVRAAFRQSFMKDGLPILCPEGEYENDERRRVLKPITQTGIALILAFGLYEPHERDGLLAALLELIHSNGGCMSTGFVGTPYLLHALTDAGRPDVAYDLLFCENAPSWLFSVLHGATTMWEHWDSINEQGELWSADMNSFNHYAYGAVADWIYGKAAGITLPDDGAGYRKVTIRPYTDARLGHLSVREQTPLGTLGVRWQYFGDSIRYNLDIPEGCTAHLALKGAPEQTVGGGRYLFVLPRKV